VGLPTPEQFAPSSVDLHSRGLDPEREEPEHEEKGRMANIVAKTGIRREKGWLYFLDKRGDVSRARMARGGGRAPKGQQKVTRVGVKREEGWLYYIDKQGNVCKVKMKRSAGGRRRTTRRTAARRAPARRRTARGTARRTTARRTTRRRARR
jgi:hypothetical protein